MTLVRPAGEAAFAATRKSVLATRRVPYLVANLRDAGNVVRLTGALGVLAALVNLGALRNFGTLLTLAAPAFAACAT